MLRQVYIADYSFPCRKYVTHYVCTRSVGIMAKLPARPNFSKQVSRIRLTKIRSNPKSITDLEETLEH